MLENRLLTFFLKKGTFVRMLNWLLELKSLKINNLYKNLTI
nr:MAG TPA: hypothetical protein [Caudoviricetes sp.]DAV86303.1 MAG TPA: hypothetical protein [Caudoviricetes sp.]